MHGDDIVLQNFVQVLNILSKKAESQKTSSPQVLTSEPHTFPPHLISIERSNQSALNSKQEVVGKAGDGNSFTLNIDRALNRM